jgi:hypothetical protein
MQELLPPDLRAGRPEAAPSERQLAQTRRARPELRLSARDGDRDDRSRTLSAIELLLGSLSSAGAALLVHALWAPGAILGAAVTPVVIALLTELLRRPVDLVVGVRPRLRRVPTRRGVMVVGDGETIRVYRARPRWTLAIATGLLAFAIGGASLTLSESLLDRSLVDPGSRSTLLQRPHPADQAPAARQPAPPAESRSATSDPHTRDTSRLDRALRPRRADRARPATTGARPTGIPTPTSTATPSPTSTPLPSPSSSPAPSATAAPSQPPPGDTGTGSS